MNKCNSRVGETLLASDGRTSRASALSAIHGAETELNHGLVFAKVSYRIIFLGLDDALVKRFENESVFPRAGGLVVGNGNLKKAV